ncbi:MAG: type II toxin-antitoxin system HicB family antitoxin [Bacteroidales bacterium]|nr:type II toxin-antitoxin system HicB family antitoxin [Bacteroidales bacterium]
MEYTICVEKNEDGWLTGQCEQLPQAISQGKDINDLMENMKDAIELVLEVKRDEFRKNYHSKTAIVKNLTLPYETKRSTEISKRKWVPA